MSRPIRSSKADAMLLCPPYDPYSADVQHAPDYHGGCAFARRTTKSGMKEKKIISNYYIFLILFLINIKFFISFLINIIYL